jgi:hypothetical protein
MGLWGTEQVLWGTSQGPHPFPGRPLESSSLGWEPWAAAKREPSALPQFPLCTWGEGEGLVRLFCSLTSLSRSFLIRKMGG